MLFKEANEDSLGQWRSPIRHHHPKKNPVVLNTLDPHQPVETAGLPCWCLLTRQALVMWWVYNKCMNSVNNTVRSSALPAKRLS